MSQQTSREPLAPPVAARLADFARACKAATRAVSLYPDGHPAITASLARLVDVVGRALVEGPLSISVVPGTLLVGQAAPARPDPAIAELADLLHGHLIGELRVVSAADPSGWRDFLLLLAQPPTDVQAQGGIARLWQATGGPHVEVREVDYAEVLREREAGIAAHWDTIIEHCLQGDALELDDETLRVLLEIAGDSARLADLASQVDERARGRGLKVQTESLIKLLRSIADAASRLAPDRADAILSNISTAASRLSPDVMLELMTHRYESTGEGPNVIDEMLTRMTDDSVSQFVARSIVEEHGATERLVQAFQALVPEGDRRNHLVQMVHEQVAATPFGAEASFPELWKRASEMLTSYSDAPYVSNDYASELSGARGHAADLERIADDPPERVAAWLSTVSDASVRALDLALLLDLMRLETDPDRFREVLEPVTAHLDDLVLLGDLEAAAPLARSIASAAADARNPRQKSATAALHRIQQGPLINHLVSHLRTLDDEAALHARSLVMALGPATIRPLADALTSEDRGRGARRITDLIVAFGKAGRDSVEQLKASTNPAVRRTAVYLLREFGGNDALPELLPLLDDADVTVQREAVRAIALIGTPQSAAVIERALTSGSERQRESVVTALSGVRDERLAPLLCHIVRNEGFRRGMRAAWLAVVEALGVAGGAEAVGTLRDALYTGEWWAPVRTAQHRRAAAAALGRIGTPEALKVLQDAASGGPRSARTAAREQLAQRGRAAESGVPS
jgi:HEAT repeat protein